ncbi:PTS sugar transporter subunit IIC [Mediterraneibacter glycyrrhizinilyticus]|uniref:PTS sugar transporter subunit IIC n=1 Tax=Mediterraneibacter glycyrrhizinilyticus TaxID=342942 RepID=UPI000E41CD6C|nr:PTS sugar transporter subunit IIC [Lachnospiraceae bacterium AM23-2LB]RJW03420.1 PTS sugar transporter subunit IIC [Lachnospiraceae bacterium AM40-2BH]
MNKFLNEKLMPVASKMASNKFLIAIRDGITLAMPLLIIGSLLMVIATGFAIPPLEKWLGDMGIATYLWKGSDSSFGLIGLVASFGIAYSLTKQYNVDGVPSGIVSLSTFILVTPFVTGEAGNGMPTTYMAAQGLFVAIVLGLINGWVYQWFINHNIQIKMPDSVPPAVSKSFSAILPGATLIVGWLIVYGVLDAFKLPNLHMIAKTVLGTPLGLLGNNIIGVVILVMCCSGLWFVGLHGGNIVNKIMEPIWLTNLGENAEAFKAGENLQHIFTTPFVDNFVYIGGAGATIGLVLALAWMARRKNASKQAKTLTPITVVPGLFNINEPTMFGIPVVLNILLLIPFVVAPVVNLIISYLSMASGLVPLTYTAPGWTTPPVISGFLATGSIRASILQIILVVADILLYLPFVAAVEKRFKADEEQAK